MSSSRRSSICEEFNRAKAEIQEKPSTIPVWQPIIAKYRPTLIGECEKAIQWSNDMVKQWLTSGMFAGHPDAIEKADQVIRELGDHALTRSHARHISLDRARSLGLNVTALEADDALQDAVLTVHHACIQTLAGTRSYKIIENHNGVAFIQSVELVMQPPAVQ